MVEDCESVIAMIYVPHIAHDLSQCGDSRVSALEERGSPESSVLSALDPYPYISPGARDGSLEVMARGELQVGSGSAG